MSHGKRVQILRVAAAGYSNNEIAAAIHLSAGTVRNQMSFILTKTEVELKSLLLAHPSPSFKSRIM